MERIFFCILLLPCLIFITDAVSRPRGVSLEKASFYRHDRDFRCFSDGKVLPFDHVNDDYCDCEDGSDEPGTSACSNGLFYCENKSYKGSYIKSSRVNDGICDCCDGSDEFEGIISCPNTCLEKYQREMAQQEALRRNQEDGYKVKQEYMQQGKRAKDEKLSKMSELEKEKDILTSEKETAENAKNQAEEPEKAAIDDHKKAWELVKAEKQRVKDAVKAGEAFVILDVNQDGSVDFPELMKHKEFDIDSDGTVSEEEAREYLEENEQVDLTIFTEKIWPNIKEIFKPAQEAADVEPVDGEAKGDGDKEEEKDPGLPEPPKEIPLDVLEGGSPEELGDDENQDIDDYKGNGDDDDEEEEDDEEDDEDDENSSYDISDKKLDADVAEEDKEPDYNEETKRLIAVADEARSKFDEAERKLRDNEREISEIKEYLEIDFGPNEEFASLKGQCFEYTDREYTYRLCPFDKSSQKSKNGGMETSLGTWGKWHGPEDDKYDTMKYENGQGCWNGPSRSSHVNLHCGATNELTSASEPSRCEYQFEFTTPARCEPPAPIHLKDVHEEL